MAQNSVTYSVDKMRVIPAEGKVAQDNPERVLTVYGVFYATDEKGKRGEQLSFTSKPVDNEDIHSDVFAIDLTTGTLTLPTAQRGRVAKNGIDADALAALLDTVRNS